MALHAVAFPSLLQQMHLALEPTWDTIQLNLPLKMLSIHLLWCLLFFKVYASEGILSSIVGTNEKTYREHVWIIIKAIAAHKSTTVRLGLTLSISFVIR